MCDFFGNIIGWYVIGLFFLDDELMKINSVEEINLVWVGFVLNVWVVWVLDLDWLKWI